LLATLDREVAALILKQGWKVRGLAVTDGTYGCETGCEYWRLEARMDDGKTIRVHGDFGTLSDYLGAPSGERRACEALAEKLGVPLTIEFLWEGDR
jgi:hypothetical protein